MLEKGLRARIGQCNISTNEELDEFLIDYIKNTFKEYASGKYKKENYFPSRYATVKVETESGVIDLNIKVSGCKNKEGPLRYVDFNIIEVT